MTIINAVKKERKGKGLLYLIAIAVLISIVFIACSKKRPTGMNDFETDIIDISDETINKNNPTADKTGGSAGNDGNSLTDAEIANLGKNNKTAYDFRGYYFESEDGTVKAQVVRMDDGSGVTINALRLKTASEKREYEIPSARNANDTTATYRVFVCRTINGNATTEATFYDGGKLTLKLQNSSGASYTLTLALKGKFLDSSDDKKTIDKIG